MFTKSKVNQLIKEAQEAGFDVEDAKKAIDKIKKGPEEKFIQTLCALRAASELAQHAHWNVKGQSFYEDHLLFQRIYRNIEGDIDMLAEKFAGLFQLPIPAVACSEAVSVYLKKWSPQDGETKAEELFKFVKVAEEDLLSLIKELSDELDGSPFKTLGFDDLIGGIASRQEENLYLINQRFRKEG
jgi:starvation-inducible DNA-binding protein